jgi:enoyl-CoA hydratase
MQLGRSDDGRVARLTLPGGPLTATAARQLSAFASQLIEDRDVRVVVLDAPGGTDFCAGAADDLTPDVAQPDPAAALARLRVPLIASIAGACSSVGIELALTCDIRLAASDASFGVPDVAAGRLPCWGGTQRLPRAVGASRASWLLFTGSEIAASTALEWGLVHEVTDDLEAGVAAVLDQLAGTGPLALELAKEAVHRGSELPLRDGLRLEGDLNHQLAATEDRAEGLAAFFDKRPPDFAGR